MGYEPALAVPAFSVSVAVAVGVTGVVFNVQVAFVGQPETVNPTALVNPFNDVTVMVEVPCVACVSDNDVGLADTEKSGVGGDPQPANLNDPK